MLPAALPCDKLKQLKIFPGGLTGVWALVPGPSARMSRIIRILALLPGCITAGWPQPPPADPQREIASRYLDWSQSNTVLFEAAQRLPPCSPRLSSLLVQTRLHAAALAKANRQYFDQYGAAARKELAENQKLASETETALGELKPLEEPERQYGQRLEAKRRRTDTDALGSLPAPGEGSVDTSGAAGLTQELRNGLSQKQTILQQITQGAETEYKLWTAYYNAFDAAMRLRCRESQPGGAKPAAPVKRR